MNSFEKEYYEADRFWKEGVLDNAENLERLSLTMEMIPENVTTLADVGCGNGLFLNSLQQKRPQLELEGVDRSEEALKYVKTKKHIADIAELDLPDHSYDCVSCLQVLEHLPVPVYEQSLRELARISKSYLLISVPYDEDLEEKMTTCPSCQTKFNSNLHLRKYGEAAFHSMFEKYGFKCIKTKFAGKTLSFKFHKEYRNLFFPGLNKKWISPICPICGFKSELNEKNSADVPKLSHREEPENASFLSIVKSVPKLLWPKEIKYYWIIGLFERTKT